MGIVVQKPENQFAKLESLLKIDDKNIKKMLSKNDGGSTKLVIPRHLLISKPSIVIEDIVEAAEETKIDPNSSFMH